MAQVLGLDLKGQSDPWTEKSRLILSSGGMMDRARVRGAPPLEQHQQQQHHQQQEQEIDVPGKADTYRAKTDTSQDPTGVIAKH